MLDQKQQHGFDSLGQRVLLWKRRKHSLSFSSESSRAAERAQFDSHPILKVLVFAQNKFQGWRNQWIKSTATENTHGKASWPHGFERELEQVLFLWIFGSRRLGAIGSAKIGCSQTNIVRLECWGFFLQPGTVFYSSETLSNQEN